MTESAEVGNADALECAVAGVFDRVPAELRGALIERGFSELTTVQTATLDAAGAGRDLRITSQTGSGKTIALGFAMAPSLIRSESTLGEKEAGESMRRPGPSALIIVPTRELAAQIREELDWLFAAVKEVQVDCVTGGTSLYQDKRRLSRRPSILVGTPGRLLDHIRTGVLDPSGIRELVLDEADQMLDMGFREELEGILETTPTDRRTHLVSATFPSGIQSLAKRYQNDPLHVEGTRLGAANEDIEHIGVIVDRYNRYAALVNLILLGEGERTLVFVNTRSETAELSEKLAKDGFSTLSLSGELAQEQRTRTLASFRNGRASILVATDVAARGLDVPDVATVIHTMPVRNHEIYTHRSGRTGRAGQKGRSILLCPGNKKWLTDRLLTEADVKMEWRDIPSAKVVKKTLEKRERRLIWAAIDSGEGRTENHVENAKRLLKARDAVDIVATLLQRCRSSVAREPFDIEKCTRPPRETRERREFRDRRDGRRSDGPRNGSSRGAPSRGGPSRGQPRFGSPKHSGSSARVDESYVQFGVNFGEKSHASAGRLMAIICRRGGVSSRDVGSIRIGPESSTFEISQWKARDFETKVGRPDTRDPWMRIKRS